MPSASFRMNPQRIAYFEAAGWRAYYDRRWFKMLRLIVALCQEEFHIPFPMSLAAAYYTIRASIAWVPVDHDIEKVRRYLEQFYGVTHRYSGLKFDVKQVADLELEYFDVHRRLSGVPDKTEFVRTLVKSHAALFGITPEQAQQSAELRVRANETVDRITSKTSTDVEGDWTSLEEDLYECYTSIQRALATIHQEVKQGQ